VGPATLEKDNTLEFLTVGLEEGKHWSKIWMVEVGGHFICVSVGGAAARFEKNATAPYVKVRVVGLEFDHLHAEPAPEMAEQVAKRPSQQKPTAAGLTISSRMCRRVDDLVTEGFLVAFKARGFPVVEKTAMPFEPGMRTTIPQGSFAVSGDVVRYYLAKETDFRDLTTYRIQHFTCPAAVPASKRPPSPRSPIA
jgi:hypothetical protein